MKRAAIIQGHLHAEAAATTEPYELVIRGAKVYEAEGHAPGALLDVAVRAGKIAAVEPAGTIAPGSGREEFDAAGLLLTPGLIDMHVHCFAGMTALGIEVDEWCLGRGCTTVCDAGSAGATTVEGFIRYIDGQNLTRCLSFLDISLHGLAGSGRSRCHGTVRALRHRQVCERDRPARVLPVPVRQILRGAGQHEVRRHPLP